jgi:DNA-binding PadR family transcriptional regulator
MVAYGDAAMAKQPFDMIERDRLRLAYLKALYDKEQSEKTSIGLIIAIELEEVMTILKISELQADRITSDLEAHGLIQGMGGMAYSLTDQGREVVEDHLHELHRPWHDKLKERISSPAVVGGAAGFLTSLLMNMLAASDMPWWLKLILGKK